MSVSIKDSRCCNKKEIAFLKQGEFFMHGGELFILVHNSEKTGNSPIAVEVGTGERFCCKHWRVSLVDVEINIVA